MTLYDRLKETSRKRGISLQDVATRASLGINSLYKWKSQAPTAPTIKAVADVLNVSVDYLIGNTDNPKGVYPSYAIGSIRSRIRVQKVD